MELVAGVSGCAAAPRLAAVAASGAGRRRSPRRPAQRGARPAGRRSTARAPAIVALGGVALAPDGERRLVYRKLVGGRRARVRVDSRRGGAWAAPAQVDAGVAGGRVRAGGRRRRAAAASAVTWISAGTLYGAVHAPPARRRSARRRRSPPASGTPALGMGVSGTAYVAYLDGAGAATSTSRASTAPRPRSRPLRGAADARAPIALRAAAARRSRSPRTRRRSWRGRRRWPTAATHVCVRRVSAAGPSPVLDDATVASIGGLAGGSADSPALGVAYDSSVAWVAFRETLGGVSRVVVDELLGDELRPPALADSLAARRPAPSSALAPSARRQRQRRGLLAVASSRRRNELAVAALGTPARAVRLDRRRASRRRPERGRARAAGGALGQRLRRRASTCPRPARSPRELFKRRHGRRRADRPLVDARRSARCVGRRRLSARAPTTAATSSSAYVAGAPGALRGRRRADRRPRRARRAPPARQLWTADSAAGAALAAARPTRWAPPTYAVYVDGARVGDDDRDELPLPTASPTGATAGRSSRPTRSARAPPRRRGGC